MQIEIKIPNDPAVVAAVAAWLTRLVPPAPAAGFGAEVFTAMTAPAPAPFIGEPPFSGDFVTAEQAFGNTAPALTPSTPPPVLNHGDPEPQASSNVQPALCGRGFPFDARIHAGSKQLLAKKPHGWKPLRGVDPALVAAVEAEYMAQGYGKPTATYVPPAAPAAATPPPPPPPAPAAGFGAMPPGSAFDTPAPAMTFAAVMARVGAVNKIKEAQDLLPAFQLASLPQLGTKPELWESFLATLGA